MKAIDRYIVPALLVLVICFSGICWAITIAVTGNWSETIDASDLQAGAGSDLIDTYESAAPMTIDISATAGNWALDVHKIDGDWHANFHLYVRRISDGTGSGSISGGDTYQEITGIDQGFFNGNDDRSSVNIQLRLTGVSIQVPPNVYTTTVYYTVYDQ